MDIISAENLTKTFGELVAVDNVSFSVREGEVFGFLGPNGAGKTTTMKMIQCVSPKTAGTLTVASLDIEKDPRGIKKMLGVAPQEVNLDPDFTVLENLMIYSRYFGMASKEAKERSERLLDFFQLQGKKNTPIDKLSGGMRRRLILARSMLNDPKILILDEPTVGLDPQARHLIWDQIKLLRSRGITILLTTHYMEEAAQLCDRIVIMDHGKILAEGSPRQLVEKHVAKSVIEAKGTPQVMACVRHLKGVTQIETSGEMVHVFTNYAKDVLATLMNECSMESTTVRDSTLEDVFLKLTGRMLRE